MRRATSWLLLLSAAACAESNTNVNPALDAGPSASDGGALADSGGPGPDGGPGMDGAVGVDAEESVDAYESSPELTALMAQIELARQGMPADFDGDGMPELIRGVDGQGVITTWIDVDLDGTADFLYTRAPDGSGMFTSDGDADGVPEVEATFSAGPPLSRVFLRDLNADGYFDQRTTETYGASSVELALEVDPDEDGTFTSSVTVTEALWVQAGPACSDADNFGNFPSNDSSSVTVGGNIRVLYGSEAGACTPGEANRVANAIDQAIQRAMSCVKNNNSELAGLLAEALASSRTLNVACGNNCAPAAATTDCSTGCSATRTNLNRSRLPQDSNQLSNTMMHELFHWAGAGREANHDQGHDAVYSCARYCSRCSHNTGGWVSDHKDCVQCADSLARKKACGMKVSYVRPTLNYSICHAGLSCGSAPCMTPRGVKIEICDGDTLQTGETYECCAECPANCNQSNDDPCGTMAEMDECPMPPPACR